MCPTRIRDITMKKIMTLAIMALFVCGLTINANAQDNRTATPDNSKKTEKAVKPKEPKATATVKNQKDAKTSAVQNAGKINSGKTNAIDKTLKDFEAAVDKCVSLHNNPKVDPKEFQQSLTKAESLKGEIEKAKPQMDRTQVDRFNKAVQKLSVVYAKG